MKARASSREEAAIEVVDSEEKSRRGEADPCSGSGEP